MADKGPMRFAIVHIPRDPHDLPALARATEEAGFDWLTLGDSQSIFRDVWISLAVCAMHTARVRIGPGVSNVITRHLTVTAGAAATLDELSNGRAILPLGSGDSAAYNIGERAVRLADFERDVHTLRRLLCGETVEHKGKSIHVRWANRPVPIYVGAEGPKTLRMAGRVADGVIIGTGLIPEVIADSLEYVRQGAEESGRRLEDLDIWFLTKTNIAPDRERALHEMKMAIAASGNHAFRFGLEGKRLPPEFVEPIKRLQQEYVYPQHEELGATRNAQLTDELGLTEYLAERFTVLGTPEDCVQKLQRLYEAGARQFFITGLMGDPLKFVRTWGEEVMPRLAAVRR